MSRKKKVLLALVLFLLVWVPTLGLHWLDAMRVYCRNCDAEPWNAKETPERSFRRARFAFPDAVPYRDDFELVLEGAVGDGQGDATTPVERRLRIEPDKERALVTGWDLIEGAGV